MDSHTTHNHPDKTPIPGTFTAVLADPPWQLQQKGTLGAANHYDLMTDQRILDMGAALKEVMAENSFCFLWVTTATVPLGIEVLEAWGFRYTSFDSPRHVRRAVCWCQPALSTGSLRA